MSPCRLCARAAPAARPLFPRAAPAPRAARLRRATGLTIKMDDGLPQTMCKECADLVDAALYLQDQCLLAEQKLLDMGFKKQHSDLKSDTESLPEIKSIQYIEIHNNYDTHSPSSPLHQETEEKFNVNSSVPLFEDAVEVKTEVKCETVLLKSKNIMKLKKKRKRKECSFTNDRNTQKHKECDAKIIKVECEKERLKSKRMKCKDKSFKDSSDGKLAFRCKVKSNRTNYIDKLKKCQEFSDSVLNKNGPYRCKVCKSVSSTISLFYAHLRIHIGYDHVCEFCGKKFYAALSLKRHCMSWHGLQKELSCSQCDHKAISTSRLREHERTHTGEKPFECDVCGGKFHSRSSIVQHLGLHFASKTVPCDRCPSMFKNRRALTTHINQSHVRDYLYLCYICDKKYSKNTTARKHLTKQHGVPRSQQGKIPRFSRSRAAIVNL